MDMNTKIALVTGGSRGLGKEMALALGRAGYHVIITYRSQKEQALDVIKQLAEMHKQSFALELDMAIPEKRVEFMHQLKQLLQQQFNNKGLDALVNNAGIGKTIPIAQVDEAAFDELMNVHFKGVYFLTQQCLLLMNDGASIINVSTGTTRFCVPGYSVYSSLKAAVEVFTKYLAKEYGSRGIRANVVAPGPVETDFNEAAIRNNPQMKTYLSSLSPLGRVGAADDIGEVVSFLCSDGGRWINGQRIEVSGGINL